MPVVRQYVMIAAEGKEPAMREGLAGLAAKVRALDGCEAVELYQDPAKPTYFVFNERWTSVDHHQAGGRHLGKDALADILAVIAQPPEGRYLEPVDL